MPSEGTVNAPKGIMYRGARYVLAASVPIHNLNKGKKPFYFITNKKYRQKAMKRHDDEKQQLLVPAKAAIKRGSKIPWRLVRGANDNYLKGVIRYEGYFAFFSVSPKFYKKDKIIPGGSLYAAITIKGKEVVKGKSEGFKTVEEAIAKADSYLAKYPPPRF